MTCCGFTDETAIVGSFWRCRYGSPPGHWTPDTMFTLSPPICARAEAARPKAARRHGAAKTVTTLRRVSMSPPHVGTAQTFDAGAAIRDNRKAQYRRGIAANCLRAKREA